MNSGKMVASVVVTLVFVSQFANSAPGQIQQEPSSADAALEAIISTPPIPSDQAPRTGTFFSAKYGEKAPPMPSSMGLPVWSLGNDQYLIDDLETANTSQSELSVNSMTMSASDSPPSPGGGGSTNGYTNTFVPYTFPTNELWLSITNTANGRVSGILHNATNTVYAILGGTNVAATNWNIEQALFPNSTQAVPFSLPALNRQTLFLHAKDWTGVTHGGNVTPDWWFWYYFGTTALSDSNLDSQGNTLSSDYQNGTDPNIINFNISTANNYVNGAAPLQLTISSGSPSYIAVSIDDSNYLANANWQPFSSYNQFVNLGNEGWHNVWIGLRGLPPAATQTWQYKHLKYDHTPPVISVTNPATGTVNVSLVQLQGFSTEALQSISYNITNAAGVLTNQSVVIVNQIYNTNTLEFTTNCFQGYDVRLTNGINSITLRACDLAGNTTVTNFNIVLDYSKKTNPPSLQVNWPKPGTAVCGTSFTCRGWVSDPTATVVIQQANNGITNISNATVGRDGSFWSGPLANQGASVLVITATDAVGNSSVTNLNITKGTLGLTIDPVSAGQTTITGTISSNTPVVVNGVPASNNGNGTWTVTIPPVGSNGGSVQATAGSQGVETPVQAPQGIYISSFHKKWQNASIGDGFTNYSTYITSWSDGQGGTVRDLDQWGNSSKLDATTWPATAWPQSLPYGTETVYTNGAVYYTDTVYPPNFPQTHYDGKYGPGQDDFQTIDTEMKLATGGPLGSTEVNFWLITADATAYTNYNDIYGESVPPEQISIGGFGNLDTNGELYVLLPDNDPNNVTPKVPGKDRYNFSVSGIKYTLYHATAVQALSNPDLGRTTIGVGEIVNFGGMPPKTKWAASAGSLSVNTGSSTTFTAPNNAANATITMTIGKLTKTITFNVVEPSGYDHANVTATNHYTIGTAGAGMTLSIYIAPTSVSFVKVSIMEIGLDASNVSGYFTNFPAQQLHHSSDIWVPLDSNNLFGDNANASGYPPVWTSGSFTWNIPVKWSVQGSGVTNSMKNGWSQVFSIDPLGTMTVTKFGRSVTRTTNDVITVK